MVVIVLSLGAVGLVWYSLSWLSVLSSVFQIDGQVWLLYTLGKKKMYLTVYLNHVPFNYVTLEYYVHIQVYLVVYLKSAFPII